MEPTLAVEAAAPQLEFAVEDVAADEHAAVPTLRFRVAIESGDREVRSLALNVQIRIDAPRRAYTDGEQARLYELYGSPPQWSTTLRSLLWAHATVNVPPFTSETTVDIPVPCTYDFEVAAAKYLAALEDGSIPLELLFSGTIFYTDGPRLQVAHVPWDREARYALPVAAWRRAVDSAFPNSAWLRVHRDTFERLHSYKASHGQLTWDATVEDLLERGG